MFGKLPWRREGNVIEIFLGIYLGKVRSGQDGGVFLSRFVFFPDFIFRGFGWSFFFFLFFLWGVVM